MFFSRHIIATLTCGVVPIRAAFDLGYHDDSDLTNFVTRPEIKAPIFNVSIYDRDAIAPGYWFVAPYAFIRQEYRAKKYYQPCQTGPQIYDGNGDLVWSGACTVRNQNTCDFRVWQFNDTFYLSALLTADPSGNDAQGHGVIWDSSYDIVDTVYVPPTIREMNMHELNLLNHGRSALHIIARPMFVDVSEMNLTYDAGWILDMGFREVDIVTGDTLFQWWAHDGGHVHLSESRKPVQNMDGPYPKSWNWFHANSIEKNAEGDYLFNSRYTDTIFKVSGQDGSILWRLGGTRSSFQQNFNFSRQHDVRWLYQDGNTEVLTFLNNGADDEGAIWTHSAAFVVELDTAPSAMTARLRNQIDRPDHQLSRLRGNYQPLPNGNAFICWSENSYLSEHGPDGRILMEAKFQSTRFVTYRGYKFDFVGRPREDPAVKAFAYGVTPNASTTVVYVSWNGATEVVAWRFWAVDDDGDDVCMMGEKRKTGFETAFQARGYYARVFAQGIAANGSVLGASVRTVVVAPSEWDSTLVTEDEDCPPRTPEGVLAIDGQSTVRAYANAATWTNLVDGQPAMSSFLFVGGMLVAIGGLWRLRWVRFNRLRRGFTHAVAAKTAC